MKYFVIKSINLHWRHGLLIKVKSSLIGIIGIGPSRGGGGIKGPPVGRQHGKSLILEVSSIAKEKAKIEKRNVKMSVIPFIVGFILFSKSEIASEENSFLAKTF